MSEFDFLGAGGGNGIDVVISRHARSRWAERLEDWALRRHPILPTAWRSSEVVIAPQADCDETRLYVIEGHRDMLLCGKHYPEKTVVATVLYADHSRLSRF